MALVADNIHDKIQISLRSLMDLDGDHQSPQAQASVQSEERKIRLSKSSSACPTSSIWTPTSNCSISPGRHSSQD